MENELYFAAAPNHFVEHLYEWSLLFLIVKNALDAHYSVEGSLTPNVSGTDLWLNFQFWCANTERFQNLQLEKVLSWLIDWLECFCSLKNIPRNPRSYQIQKTLLSQCNLRQNWSLFFFLEQVLTSKAIKGFWFEGRGDSLGVQCLWCRMDG